MDHPDIIDTLNALIETCKDGEYGFRTSAEHAVAAQVRQLFLTRAEDCRQASSELQSLVLQYGGKAEDGGSVSGALHRGWVKAKSALTTATDLSLLEETERGEDVALAAYRRAIEEELPDDVRAVLTRHLQGVKRNHDQIRDLRNQARTMAA